MRPGDIAADADARVVASRFYRIGDPNSMREVILLHDGERFVGFKNREAFDSYMAFLAGIGGRNAH